MNNLKRILDLAKKTGDKIIVTDSNGEMDFVVMPLRDYEKIVEGEDNIKDLNEEELWNKVDRDIAIWKAEHEENIFDSDLISSEINPWDEDPHSEEWGTYDAEKELIAQPWDEDPIDSHFSEESFNEEEFEEYEKDAWENSLQQNKFDLEDDEFFRKDKDFFEIKNEDLKEDEDVWSDDEIKEKTVGDALEFVEKHEAESVEHENEEVEKKGKARFAIPKNRIEHIDEIQIKANDVDETFRQAQGDLSDDKSIQYEDIPPPPDVKLEDLINKKEPVIDASFEDEDELDLNEDFEEDEVFFEE